MNDGNFVRLNLRVKKYARGKGGRSGSSHKRFAWKQKMKSRAESYGSTGAPGSGNCFKCGQPGHWANKCRGIIEIDGGQLISSFSMS